MSLEIINCRIEYAKNPYTDKVRPRLTYQLTGGENGFRQSAYQIKMQDWDSGRIESSQRPYLILEGELKPYTHYDVKLSVWDDAGNTAEAHTSFETARMDASWQPSWITDERIRPEKKKSPHPIVFRKTFQVKGAVNRVLITSTAVGNYYLSCNGKRVSRDILAPGYTSYAHTLQYQVYDMTEYLLNNQRQTSWNELTAVVSGGWAVGVFGASFRSCAYADRQLFAAEIRMEYEDGTVETICTDTSWMTAVDGAYQEAGIYEGVTYDARITTEHMNWKNADSSTWKYQPEMTVTYGILPRRMKRIAPIKEHASKKGGMIYDFGQNCAAVVRMHIKNAARGQKIVVRHAEILDEGELLTANLVRAKAEVRYICIEGEQDFSPELTYMGFRYIHVSGIEPENIEVQMEVISSITENKGRFRCSDDRLNQLQQNIMWSGLSNFVDIPTDCPQRDERMGWTGDIALFSSTACFNFDMYRFLDKWLLDVLYEQGKHGEIGSVVPAGKSIGTGGFSAGWADCGTMVPWALYMKYADTELLKRQYPGMRKLVEAEAYWSKFFSVGKKRYIWKGTGQMGDWLCPGSSMMEWGKVGVPAASAFFFNTCKITERTALILGDTAYAKRCAALSAKVEDAFREIYTDGTGRLKKEWQTCYATAIYFGMLTDAERQAMGGYLDRLVKENHYKISTGFLGTPYILFALSDTGHLDTAYQMLMQEDCPGWLYSLKTEATTIWECWDAVLPDGKINLNTGRPKFGRKPPHTGYDPDDRTLPGLSSLNHYAYGAVGDWLYRRITGLEAIEPGYRRFRVAPMAGGGLTWAECETECPYGTIRVRWEIIDGRFSLNVCVPAGTTCEVLLPGQEKIVLESGKFSVNNRRKKR